MTLPASGLISISAIAAEINIAYPGSYASGGPITLNDTAVRTLAGVLSGTISLANFYGKSSTFIYNITFSGNYPNFVLYSALIAAGWNGVQPVHATLTINAGVYVYGSNTNTPAIQICGLPAYSVVTIVNSGVICGCGGAPGAGGWVDVSGSGNPYNGASGAGGGAAIILGYPVTIYNYGIIGGGGGGGGGGAWAQYGVSSSSCCFIAGTRISTPNGVVLIEDVALGDVLTSFDVQRGVVGVSVVSMLIRRSRSGYYSLTTSDGTIIGVTNDHPMFDPVQGSWVAIDPVASAKTYREVATTDLIVGGHLLTESGKVVEVSSFEYIERQVPVYTFSLDGHHTYYANGLLTHNNLDGC